MKTTTLPPLLAALTLAFAAPLSAQVVAAEPALYTLKDGETSLTQILLPVGVTLRSARVRVDMNAAFMRVTLAAGDQTSELSGLTDVTVRAILPLANDRVRLALAGNLPTGRTALAADQLGAASALATDLYLLPVSGLGSGLGVSAMVAYAQPVGAWVAGASGTYRLGSGYTTTPGGAEEFVPSNEARLRFALERPHRTGRALRVGASYSRFSATELRDGSAVADFHPGDRFIADASFDVPVGRGAATAYVWSMYRAASGDSASTPFPHESAVRARNLAGVGTRLSLPLGPTLSLRPMGELIVQSTPGVAADEAGDGFLARAGSGFAFRAGRLAFEPALLVQVGRRAGVTMSGLVLRGGVAW